MGARKSFVGRGVVAAIASAGLLVGSATSAGAHAGPTAAPQPSKVVHDLKARGLPVGTGAVPDPLRPPTIAIPSKQPRFGPVRRVPGLGRAEYDAGRDVYRVHLPGGTTGETHGLDNGFTDSAELDLPTSEAYPPVCADPTSGHRIVLVYAHVAGRPNNYAVGAAYARVGIRRASTKLAVEAIRSSGGQRSAVYKVACDESGNYIVRDIEVASENVADIAAATRLLDPPATTPPAPHGPDATRYVVFADTTGGSAGEAVGFTLTDFLFNYAKTTFGCYNNFRCDTTVSVVFQPFWAKHTLMHEIAHAMGAVQAHDNPYSGGGGHCTDGMDVMCNNTGPGGGAFSRVRCPTATYGTPDMLPFDCGYDTYFSTISHLPQQWTDLYWNVGGRENDFLSYTPAWPVPVPPTPTAVVDAAGTRHLFLRGVNGALWHRYKPSGGSWTQEQLGGSMTGGASAKILVGGDIVVFYRGTDGHIHEYHYDGTWHPSDLGGSPAGDPVAVQLSGGEQAVYFRGTDGTIKELFYDGTWHSFGLGGAAAGDPTALAMPGNQQAVYFRGTDGTIKELFYDGTWHSYGLGGTPAGDPSAVVMPGGEQGVFFRGTDGGLKQLYYDGTWHNWGLGGTMTGDPTAVVVSGGGQLVYYGTGNDAFAEGNSSGWTHSTVCGDACGFL